MGYDHVVMSCRCCGHRQAHGWQLPTDRCVKCGRNEWSLNKNEPTRKDHAFLKSIGASWDPPDGDQNKT